MMGRALDNVPMPLGTSNYRDTVSASTLSITLALVRQLQRSKNSAYGVS